MEKILFTTLLDDKSVVADTSALLMIGTKLLDYLNNCELIIPAVVIQELEDKRAHPTLGQMARQWINTLEKIRFRDGKKLSTGVMVAPGIKIRVEPNHSNQSSLPKQLQNGSHDSTILAVAKNLQNENQSVVLLSNDIPMRLHATLDLDLQAYEFSSTDLESEDSDTRLSLILTAKEFYSISSPLNLDMLQELIDKKIDTELPYYGIVDVFTENSDKAENSKELVMSVQLANKELKEIPERIEASRIHGRTLEQRLALAYLQESPADLPIVSVAGPAGSGKTLLTVATALDGLKAGQYQKIVVFRSLHEMGQGQEVGFLPGDLDHKMDPWAGAIYDALDVVAHGRQPDRNKGPKENKTTLESRKKIAEELRSCIEVSPITYLRGRSLANSFIILDEAQNFSKIELLNIISRVGANSKIVLLADPLQVDNRFLQSGDKADIWAVINKLKKESVFAHVTLTRTERSKVAEIASRILSSEIN